MNLKNRITKLQSKVNDLPKEVITYTILDSEIANGEIVKFIVQKEFRGNKQLMEREEYLKELGYYKSMDNIKVNLKSNLTKYQLNELVECQLEKVNAQGVKLWG